MKYKRLEPIEGSTVQAEKVKEILANPEAFAAAAAAAAPAAGGAKEEAAAAAPVEESDEEDMDFDLFD